MLFELCSAFALLALCVAGHAGGLIFLLRWLLPAKERGFSGGWQASWLLIRTAWALSALHIGSILVWAAFYWWQDCLADFETAVYFSGVSYATIGYGDVVLPRHWWFLAPMEGLTGILMCGLSTGFFFVVVSKVFAAKQVVAEAAP
ncbi:MAG TPA: potassium channel family protein [Verrucomicrobiales bacterium]|jgi:hypothetical protein|nr:potassium channel family protein [Verrucomicrobiales bacterium]